jgi:2-oxopent-4-enoate/cis-2-oxohex-4-enoate hydratase
VTCVAWLANTLGAFGIPLEAGEVILSGSLVPLEPVKPGDLMRVTIGGLGTASVRFV